MHESINSTKIIEALCPVIKNAGELTLDYFRKGFDIQSKSDNSPVTSADLSANQCICDFLNKNEWNIPIISEENNAQADWETRKDWGKCWLVDPLDGTREFIKGIADFTVNIALIEKGHAIIGLVYAPAKNLLYYGSAQNGSYLIQNDGEPKKINTRNIGEATIKLVGSRSSQSDKMSEVRKSLPADHEYEGMGSSLKLCIIAEGKADLYYRFGPTYEWDTAAGHCILQHAGGQIFSINSSQNNEVLLYNSRETLLNSEFVATGEIDYNWKQHITW